MSPEVINLPYRLWGYAMGATAFISCVFGVIARIPCNEYVGICMLRGQIQGYNQQYVHTVLFLSRSWFVKQNTIVSYHM